MSALHEVKAMPAFPDSGYIELSRGTGHDPDEKPLAFSDDITEAVDRIVDGDLGPVSIEQQDSVSLAFSIGACAVSRYGFPVLVVDTDIATQSNDHTARAARAVERLGFRRSEPVSLLLVHESGSKSEERLDALRAAIDKVTSNADSGLFFCTVEQPTDESRVHSFGALALAA